MEFALLLPIILLLVLGVVDFGRFFYTKMALTNAAREGANYLAYYPSDTTYYITAIKNEADSSGIDPELLNIPEPTKNSYSTYEEVGVTVELLDIDLFFSNFYKLFFPSGDTIDLSSTVWMVVQSGSD